MTNLKFDVKKLKPADVKSICDAAAAAWDKASPKAKVCTFVWRGKKLKTRLTSFRMVVETMSGSPVAARYN